MNELDHLSRFPSRSRGSERRGAATSFRPAGECARGPTSAANGGPASDPAAPRTHCACLRGACWSDRCGALRQHSLEELARLPRESAGSAHAARWDGPAHEVAVDHDLGGILVHGHTPSERDVDRPDAAAQSAAAWAMSHRFRRIRVRSPVRARDQSRSVARSTSRRRYLSGPPISRDTAGHRTWWRRFAGRSATGAPTTKARRSSAGVPSNASASIPRATVISCPAVNVIGSTCTSIRRPSALYRQSPRAPTSCYSTALSYDTTPSRAT